MNYLVQECIGREKSTGSIFGSFLFSEQKGQIVYMSCQLAMVMKYTLSATDSVIEYTMKCT